MLQTSTTAVELKSTLFSRMSYSKKKETAGTAHDTSRLTRTNNDSATSLQYPAAVTHTSPSSSRFGHNKVVSPREISNDYIDSSKHVRHCSPFNLATRAGILSGTG